MPCDFVPIPDANLQVIGPAGGVTDGHVAVFDGTSGQVVKDGGAPTSGVSTTGSPASGNLTKFSGASSITNADLTGDVTTTGTVATTIANDVVTNAKLANMADSTIKGRAVGAGTGDPTDLSATQSTAILNTFVGDSGAGGTKGLVPAPAAGDAAAGKFLKADGTFQVPPASGDVVGPSSAVADRIATFDGTTGKLIKDGGQTIAQVIAAASGGAGLVQLAQIVTSGSQTTVDFTSIPGGYNALKILYISQDTTAGTSASTVRIRLNNDSTAANYTATYRIGTQGGSAFGSSQAATTGGVAVGPQPNAGNTGWASSGEITINGYANTTFHKRIIGITAADWSGSDQLQTIQARWNQTTAISRVTFTTDGTAFTNGSVFTLYGVN